MILRYLHFSENGANEGKGDRAWKIRPVITALNKSFAKAYRLGKYISFDEAIIPNISRYNPLQTYCKGKPHPWGVKLFYVVLCENGFLLIV